MSFDARLRLNGVHGKQTNGAWRPPDIAAEDISKAAGVEGPPPRFYTEGFSQELLEGERDDIRSLQLPENAPRGQVVATVLDICRMAMTWFQIESVCGNPAKYMKWFGLLYAGGILKSRLILSPDPAAVRWGKVENGQVVDCNLADLLKSLGNQLPGS